VVQNINTQNRTKEELDAKKNADISAFPYDVHIKFESNVSFKKKIWKKCLLKPMVQPNCV